MSETSPEKAGKTAVQKMRDVISQLKEMDHYSRTNIERLSESWLLFEDELKRKEFAGKMSDLLATQNAFQERVVALTAELEADCDAAEEKEK